MIASGHVDVCDGIVNNNQPPRRTLSVDNEMNGIIHYQFGEIVGARYYRKQTTFGNIILILS